MLPLFSNARADFPSRDQQRDGGSSGRDVAEEGAVVRRNGERNNVGHRDGNEVFQSRKFLGGHGLFVSVVRQSGSTAAVRSGGKVPSSQRTRSSVPGVAIGPCCRCRVSSSARIAARFSSGGFMGSWFMGVFVGRTGKHPREIKKSFVSKNRCGGAQAPCAAGREWSAVACAAPGQFPPRRDHPRSKGAESALAAVTRRGVAAADQDRCWDGGAAEASSGDCARGVSSDSGAARCLRR